MLIEHSFVTTLDPQQAMETAAALLAAGGFAALPQQSFALNERAWNTLDVRRGRKTATRAKDATQCPQQIRLEWDRGRVSIASTIEPSQNRTFLYGGLFGAMAIAAASRPNRRTQASANLMIVICNAIEASLANGLPVDDAAADWMRYEAELREAARRRRVRSNIAVGIFLAIVVTVIVLVAYFNTGHH